MLYNNTVAILGAGSSIGQHIAKNIAANYSLLLMDSSADKLNNLMQFFVDNHPTAKVEMIVCSKEASWEADIIIIAADHAQEQEAIAIKINEVSTCKTVIQIKDASSDMVSLQAILPYSKFISVDWANTAAIVEGNDEVSLSITGEIVHLCGLKPIFKKSLI
ncbi:hypothetical protein [Sediminibacterium sp.]|uniref:hypothetical protein n=1 Tax=Sediminibacterium sp. TaxID=1917865 RepID=UPI0025E0A1F9|nr:hypothetical protein [Sediminibacterium sp.]MBT9485626.1 hypothetical protein [Sediminibacterium sp.]